MAIATVSPVTGELLKGFGELTPEELEDKLARETWRNFGVPVPAPMYHGNWAVSFQRDMKLEGDVLVLMQNLRCITRQIELLRAVGAPV